MSTKNNQENDEIPTEDTEMSVVSGNTGEINPSYEPEVEINSNENQHGKTKDDSQVQITMNENENHNVTPWKPYEDSKFDSPVFNRFLLPWPLYYKVRWKILSIFHTRLLFGIVLGEVIFFLLVIGGLAGALAAIGATRSMGGGDNDNDDDEGEDNVDSTGSIAIIPPALSFVFACRNSVWIVLTGLPFERALLWHKFFAYITVIVAVWHGYISWEWDVTGTALTAVFVALPLFAFFPLRRKFFEAFYRLHWILVIAVIALSLAHGAGGILFGAAFWLVDLVLRALITLWNKKLEHSVLAVRLPSDVIRLTFLKKDFKYKSGQYLFICIPGVTWFEWHPFSLSSSPHENVVSIHIRVLGDWRKRLYDHVQETKSITVYIDGPYGAPGVDVDGRKYKSFMFISGGIGITPMQSICNDILYQNNRGRPINKVMFVWSVRDLYMVNSVLEYDRKYYAENMSGRLPHSFSPDLLNRNLGEVLETYFHLTRERDSSKFEEANIRPELQTDLKFGRPSLTDLFTRMKSISLKGSRIAVLTCGPTALVNDAEKFCSKFSGGGVIFDFHKEIFEF